MQIENDNTAVKLKFEDVVEPYYQPLFQFACSLTGCEADAWDLVQHTFYTWRIKGGQLRDSSKVKTWLFTTLHRAFLQTKRHDVRFRHYELDEVHAELPSVAPAEFLNVDSANVVSALNTIDDAFRLPLALFYFEDRAYKEIAAMLQIPIGTVKSRIARGIAQIRSLLSTDLDQESIAA